ncbi:hypothetical protein [Streptomyces decoyicus]
MDALAVLNALAHASRPITADFLAESLGWDLDRVSDAIERAWAYPHLAGPYALRRAAPAHFTLSPRLDVLTDRQMNWVHPANHTQPWRHPQDAHYRPLQRDVLSSQDAAVLFQASYDGTVSTDPEEPTAATVGPARRRAPGPRRRRHRRPGRRRPVQPPPHRRRRRQYLLTHLMAEPLTSSGRLR